MSQPNNISILMSHDYAFVAVSTFRPKAAVVERFYWNKWNLFLFLFSQSSSSKDGDLFDPDFQVSRSVIRVESKFFHI